MRCCNRVLLFLLLSLACVATRAEPPGVSYIFPAGAQSGTEIEARVGGFYFHGSARFHLDGEHVSAREEINATETLWFEGPMIFQPDSQQQEDYPKDHLVQIRIDAAAKPGIREWYCKTDQGTTRNLKFVIGELPEVVELEIEGDPITQSVTLPVTINGRIFPREDVDLWEFNAEANDEIVCTVAARQIGYPLDAVLAVMGPDGRAVDLSGASKSGDPEIAFVAPQRGSYQIRINDANFGGLQNYVYRLTIRRGHRVTGVLPLGGEAGKSIDLAVTTSDGMTHKLPITLPEKSVTMPITIDGHTALLPLQVSKPGERVFDGMIDKPGRVDAWPIDLAQDETIAAEILAYEFGSRLDSVIVIEDESGNDLARNDDRSDGQPDSRIVFTAKQAGKYFVKVSDQFSSRGGPGFGYRLRISPIDEIDFELKIAPDPINIPRLSQAAATTGDPPPKPARGTGLSVTLVPIGTLKNDIELSIEGLPQAVEFEGTKLSYRSKKTEILFWAMPDAPLTTSEITLVGKADLGEGKTITRRAQFPVRFSVVPSVPFKHVGQYWVTNDYPSGSLLVKRYTVERIDGFDGPLRAMLADRQLRHLQGVTAPVVDIPAEATSFDFPITFPPTMELGRTSRVQLMLVGEVDGKTVSYTTAERNEQMITVTTQGLLNIETTTPTVAVTPGSSVEIPITVQRDRALANRPVRILAGIPTHFQGISAEQVTLSGEQDSALFKIDFAAEAIGPFNTPLRILAETVSDNQSPHTAEASVELVSIGRSD